MDISKALNNPVLFERMQELWPFGPNEKGWYLYKRNNTSVFLPTLHIMFLCSRYSEERINKLPEFIRDDIRAALFSPKPNCKKELNEWQRKRINRLI